MNPNNPLYEYAELLNSKGKLLVKRFMKSKEYADLNAKIADIDDEIDCITRTYERKIRNLKEAKNNVLYFEIPKAKDEYVREHIESYKKHLTTKQELYNASSIK